MAIASEKPLVSNGPKPSIPVIADKPYKGIVVDTKYTPLSSLLTYIAGSSWIVQYYSQIVDSSNDLKGQDPGLSPIHQQYTCIKEFELKVTSALTTTHGNDSKDSIITGSANIYPFIIPNIGDMFIASTGDGREAIFRLTNTEHKSMFKQGVYSIDYEFIYFADVRQDMVSDLQNKVVKTVHYVKNFLQLGKNPILVEDDYKAVLTLQEKYKKLVFNYFNWFFSREFSTLLVPGQDVPTYDPYMTDFVLKTLDTTEADQIRFIRRLNVSEDDVIKQPTILTSILNRDIDTLSISNRFMSLIGVDSLTRDPTFNGIRWTGIKYIVYPKESARILDYVTKIIRPTPIGLTLNNVPTQYGSLPNILPTNTLVIEGKTINFINNIVENDTYIFSNKFYDNDGSKTVLEGLVLEYLNKRTINPNRLLNVISNYLHWGQLEQFYYIPIILVLIKSAIGDID